MRPLTHVTTSSLVALIIGLYLGIEAWDLITWLIIAALATVAIDLDHFLLQLLMPERRHNVIEIFQKSRDFIDVDRIVEKLHFRGFGMMRMIAHLAETALVQIISAYYHLPYSTPLLASLWTHCILDLVELVKDPGSR